MKLNIENKNIFSKLKMQNKLNLINSKYREINNNYMQKHKQHKINNKI